MRWGAGFLNRLEGKGPEGAAEVRGWGEGKEERE